MISLVDIDLRSNISMAVLKRKRLYELKILLTLGKASFHLPDPMISCLQEYPTEDVKNNCFRRTIMHVQRSFFK